MKMNETSYNDISYEMTDNTQLYIALKRKSDNFLIAATDEEYGKLEPNDYAVHGIIIRNQEDDIDILFAGYETNAIAGEGPDDIPETDKRRKNANPNPVFNEMDGEENTQWQLSNYGHHDGCAICEAAKFGWLPSCGELGLIYKYEEKFNELAALAGITPMSDAEYWTSTQYSKDYMWSVENNSFMFWRSKSLMMKVRPAKSGAGYQATVQE